MIWSIKMVLVVWKYGITLDVTPARKSEDGIGVAVASVGGGGGGNEGRKCRLLFINSLFTVEFEWNLSVIFIFLVINDGGISCKMALILLPLDFTDDKSTSD